MRYYIFENIERGEWGTYTDISCDIDTLFDQYCQRQYDQYGTEREKCAITQVDENEYHRAQEAYD